MDDQFGAHTVPDITVDSPDGTFYLFLDIRQRGVPAERAAAILLERGVGVLPGTAYGAEGEGHLRVALVRPEEEILVALDLVTQPW